MRTIPQLVSIIVYMDFFYWSFFSCYLRVIGNVMIGDAIEVTLLFSTSMGVGDKILLGKNFTKTYPPNSVKTNATLNYLSVFCVFVTE